MSLTNHHAEDFLRAYKTAWSRVNRHDASTIGEFERIVADSNVRDRYATDDEFGFDLDFWSAYWAEGVSPDDLEARLRRHLRRNLGSILRATWELLRGSGPGRRMPPWLRLPRDVAPIVDNAGEAHLVSAQVRIADEFRDRLAEFNEAVPVEELTEDGETREFRGVEVWLTPGSAPSEWKVMAGVVAIGTIQLALEADTTVKRVHEAGGHVIGDATLQMWENELDVTVLLFLPLED